jgi:hypothetical protein
MVMDCLVRATTACRFATGQSLRPRISVEFRGELGLVERIFYKWMRCELAHDGGLPVDLRFKENSEPKLCVRLHDRPTCV